MSAACTERCETKAIECLVECAGGDVSCISTCVREETECIESKSPSVTTTSAGIDCMHVAIRALGTLMGDRNELKLGCPITYVPPSLAASSPSNNVRQKARWVQPNSSLNGTYKYF